MDWRRLIPGFWTQNYPTCPIWDSALNRALDEGTITNSSRYTANVGPFTVWVSNWPYAYGMQYVRYAGRNDLLPTVKTRLRLRHAVNDAYRASLARAFES